MLITHTSKIIKTSCNESKESQRYPKTEIRNVTIGWPQQKQTPD